MKNKTLLKVIATLTIGSTAAFGLAFGGCIDGDNLHTHEYAEGWTSGETTHWHEATCDDLNEGDAEYKKDETTHDDADADGKCDVCDYTLHDHAFNKESWNWDDVSHWHAATCDEHKYDFTVRDEAAEHTWGEGENANKCTVCGFEKQGTPSEEKPVESHQLTLGEEGTAIETLTTGASLILDEKCQLRGTYKLSCDDPHVSFTVLGGYQYTGNPVTFTYLVSPMAPNGPTVTVTLVALAGEESAPKSLNNVKIYLTNSQVEGTEITELGDYGSDTEASYFTQMIYKLVVPEGKTYRVTNKENADFIISTSIVEGEVHHNSAFDTEGGAIDLTKGTYFIGIYSIDGSPKAWITVSDVTA